MTAARPLPARGGGGSGTSDHERRDAGRRRADPRAGEALAPERGHVQADEAGRDAESAGDRPHRVLHAGAAAKGVGEGRQVAEAARRPERHRVAASGGAGGMGTRAVRRDRHPALEREPRRRIRRHVAGGQPADGAGEPAGVLVPLLAEDDVAVRPAVGAGLGGDQAHPARGRLDQEPGDAGDGAVRDLPGVGPRPAQLVPFVLRQLRTRLPYRVPTSPGGPARAPGDSSVTAAAGASCRRARGRIGRPAAGGILRHPLTEEAGDERP